MLILFKPFKVGNFVKAGGEAGVIVEVGIFTTELKTPDNVQIIIPNSTIMGSAITNVSAHPTRRIDMTLGVGYDDDLNKAKQIMEDLLAADERVLRIQSDHCSANLGDSSVEFVIRPWVNSADYWAVKFDFTKAQRSLMLKASAPSSAKRRSCISREVFLSLLSLEDFNLKLQAQTGGFLWSQKPHLLAFYNSEH